MMPASRIVSISIAIGWLTNSAIAQPASGFGNLDFEAGKAPWQAWHSSSPLFKKGPWDIDANIARSGKASLRIESISPYGITSVYQETDKLKPGRYLFSYWLKVTSRDLVEHCDVVLTFRKPGPDGKPLTTQPTPTTIGPAVENGWWQRRGSFTIDKDTKSVQFALRIRGATGTVWFDDIQIREQAPGDIRVTGMDDYAPEQVELGQPMVERFLKLVREKSPFLDRAKVYNQLLVDVAQVYDLAARVNRCAGYQPAKMIDKKPSADALQKLLQYRESIQAQRAILQASLRRLQPPLDDLHRTYAKLFLARDADGLKKFDQQAAELGKSTTGSLGDLAGIFKSLQQAARDAGFRWTIPRESKARPIVLSPDGKPNQLIFGTVSLSSHYELEEPLTVNRLHALSIFEAKSDGPGKYDFAGLNLGWKNLKRMGATHSSIGTALAVHSNQIAPAWFLKKYQDDPDIMMVGADGVKAARPSYSIGAPLNTWRPEVRDMTRDFVTQLGRAFREQPQFLFYVIAPENGGPFFPAERDLRSIGYNRSALPDFHAWLKKRYGDIDKLNAAWKGKHVRFEDIKPPPDLLLVNEWPRPHPLGYEFQTWRNEHHHQWLKLLYDTLKAADPNRPIMADHSSLLSQIDGGRIFDTADLVSYHHDRDYKTMLGLTYLNTLNRYAKKHLGLYENMWASQDQPVTSDERIQRAILTKYLYRLTAWGMHTQMWWYAYTSNDYMVRYNGNWFDPVYDLTILRASAAGLPVAKARVQRLGDYFLNSKIIPARIAVLQPQTSMLFQNYWKETYVEMEEMHKLLSGQDHRYELLPESYIADGRAKLDDFDIVVLPYAPYFPDKLDKLLGAWVKKGGLLLSCGPFGLYDKFGFDAPGLWTDIFGKAAQRRSTSAFPYWDQNRLWKWEMTGSKDGVVEKEHGKGKVIVTLRSLRDREFRDSVALGFVLGFDKWSRRPVRSDADGFEMTIHETPKGKRYLCVINRNVERSAAGTVTLAGVYSSVVDVDVPGGFPIPLRSERSETSFRLALEPGGFTLVALEK